MYLPNLCQDLTSSAIGLSHLSALQEPFHKPFGILVQPDHSASGDFCLANLVGTWGNSVAGQGNELQSDRCSEIKKWPKPVISGRARIPCGKVGWMLLSRAITQTVLQTALITTARADLVSRRRAACNPASQTKDGSSR